jgi:phosphate-selective porin OprO/OprP
MAGVFGALLLTPSVQAQAPAGSAPVGPFPTTASAVFAASGTVLPSGPMDIETTADPAEERWRFSWAGRPGVRFGDRFTLEVKLILQAEVRQSSLDLASRGGPSTWGLRRAGIKGSVLRYLEYEVGHDLDPGGKWRDVYLNVRPAAFAQVQVGKFKIPFGYERLTGPADLDFVNRTRASDALTPGRDVGIMAHGRAFKRALRYQAGVFKHDGDGSPAIHTVGLLPGEQPSPERRTWAGRVTIAPLRLTSLSGRYNNLEIGGAFVTSTVPEGKNHLQGETALGDEFFGRRYYTRGRRLRTGIELSWPVGPALVSAEVLRTTEARETLGVGTEAQLDNDLPDIVGQGWYAAGSWVLTGEKREGGVTPRHPFLQGGLGAVEVCARYEKLRFSSPGGQGEPASTSPRAANIRGNGESAWTGGVTWHLNRWMRVRVNGIREALDDPESGPAPGSPSFWTVVSQFQFAW